MIGFEHQQVIGLLIENLLGNLGLAPHRVERNEAVFQVQLVQQKRNGGDLVGLWLHTLLSQRESLLTRPGTDQMQRAA